jgi:hypothetical protein
MVTTLCTTISNLCVGKEIMDICKFKSGQSTMSKLNQIIISTDHLNKKSKDGDVSIQNSNLVIIQNMDQVLSGNTPKDTFWKTQELLGITNEYAKESNFESFSIIQNEFNKKMESSILFEFDYKFVNDNAFKSLSASMRNSVIGYINTTLISDVFCVEEGLFGFIRLVKDEIHKSISKISVSIDPSDSLVNPYQISIQNGILSSIFNLKEIISRLEPNSPKLSPCRLMVESILDLRKKKEISAMKEADNAITLAQHKSVIKIPIQIDWSCLTQLSEFNETTKYVEMIDHVFSVVKKCIFGQSGIPDAFPESIDALNKLKLINISVDYTNQTRKKIGLYTPNYLVSNSSGVLLIKANYNNQQRGGCGMNLEFAVTPTIAKLKEDQMTMRIEQEEEDRRRREEERKRKDEEDKRKREDEAQRKKEKKERDELDKKRREKCNHCKNGWKECSMCKGTRMVGKNKCVNCKQKGGSDCNYCKGTGLKYPNL